MRTISIVMSVLSIGITFPFLSIAKGKAETQPATPSRSIGQATMQADGTIVLDLRAEGEGGMLGDARLVYPPDHPQYREILQHLGGIKPGETRPVPPWDTR